MDKLTERKPREIIDTLARQILLEMETCVNSQENCDDTIKKCAKMAGILLTLSKTLKNTSKLRTEEVDEDEEETESLSDKTHEETIEILEGMLNYHRRFVSTASDPIDPVTTPSVLANAMRE